MTDKTRMPLPAAIADCGPFRVTESKNNNGFCVYPDNGRVGILSVPLGEKPEQFAIRLHEYGHLLLISSGFHNTGLLRIVGRERIDDSWFQSALDVVVNHYLLRLGCEEISYLPLAIRSKGSFEIASAAQTFLRSSGLKIERSIKSKVVKFLRQNMGRSEIKFLETADEKLTHWSRQKQLPVKDFIELIRKLEQIFGESYEENSGWGDIMTAGEAKEAEEGTESDDLDPADANKIIDRIYTPQTEIYYDLLNTEDRARQEQVLKDIVERGNVTLFDDDWKNWGKMEMARLPLTEIHPTRKNARKFLPGFVGAFRYPHRALLPASDGAAFAYRQKAKGGTILLDCSGSMNLSIRDISNLLYRSPMLTVAGYAGIDGRNGSLAIFIKNGILASKRTVREWYEDMNQGNIIDGPALRWLIKQRQPRIWISDGKVTGIDDHYSSNLDIEAAILKKWGRIKQFVDIKFCLRAFHTETEQLS